MKTEFARTGCHLLDLYFGGGRGLGIPYGIAINLCGDSGSGKSMLGNEMIAAEYHHRKDNFDWQYEDGENGNNFDTTELYGVDIMGKNLLLKHTKKLPIRPQTVEDMDARLSIFLEQLPKKHFGIYFVDSLDSLTDNDKLKRSEGRKKEYEEGKTFDEGTFGMASAKFLSQEFFRNQTAKLQGRKVILGIVSQVREVIGATKYQKKLKTSGGKAKKHWMDMEVWFTPIKKLKNEGSELVNGIYVEITGVKSRDGRMERRVRFLYYTDFGIDDVGTSLTFLYDLRSKDEGKFRKTVAKNIPWNPGDADKPKPDLDGVTEWLKSDKDTLDNYRDFRKKIDGKRAIKASTAMEFKETTPELIKSFEDYFGVPSDFDTLRLQIMKDPKMKKELDKRVTEKWEAIEAAAASGLGRKYG